VQEAPLAKHRPAVQVFVISKEVTTSVGNKFDVEPRSAGPGPLFVMVADEGFAFVRFQVFAGKLKLRVAAWPETVQGLCSFLAGEVPGGVLQPKRKPTPIKEMKR